jgi:hypothetical protein
VNRPTIKLVVVGKDHADTGAFRLEHVLSVVDELVLIANPGARFGGLGSIGNRELYLPGRCDVVGIVHADVEFGAGMIEALATAAVDRRALTGIVGATRQGNVWCYQVVEPVPVDTLDCCSVFIPLAPARGLVFDVQNFDGFHCCVEDLSLQAPSRGLQVLVVPGVAKHAGQLWYESSWRKEWLEYRVRLQAKWASVPFFTT